MFNYLSLMVISFMTGDATGKGYLQKTKNTY